MWAFILVLAASASAAETPLRNKLTPPGSARLIEETKTRFIEPILGGGESFAASAARTLASPDAFAAPPSDPSPTLPSLPAGLRPAADGLLDLFQTRFLSRLNPEAYANAAARALGSGRQDAGPEAPNLEDLARLPEGAAAAAPTTRLASPASFSSEGSVGRGFDSTRMVRGRGNGGGGLRPRLKPR